MPSDGLNLSWDTAWNIVTHVFAYTNHTLLPEALEKWPAKYFAHMLPRHLQIIYEINRRFMEFAREKFGENSEKLATVSIVSGEGDNQVIRMANLSIVGSFSVNGVAKIHSELVKTSLVPEFYELWPEKFTNVTNGITPRRWLLHANTNLATLISDKIGKDWIANLDMLQKIENFVDDVDFVKKFIKIKIQNRVIQLPISEILYIEYCQKHVLYHTENRVIETVGRFCDVLDELVNYGFYQVHQGYIVNFAKVRDFSGYSVILNNGKSVMISVRKKSEVLLAYANYGEAFQ